ncbi:MAG: hypothetical protein HYZ58_08965 [Acidobacteria bacterium]|nr:hypothetical protein [Acidobacteriota bacterium]MBI3263269.1 hypothetical protein [Acidobacteriota bacterium]
MADALSPTMTLRDFENGYWSLEQLKNFAERIGIPAAKKLRKDELEQAIWRSCARVRLHKAIDVPNDHASWVKVRAKRRR